jgi:hypothetical protein
MTWGHEVSCASGHKSFICLGDMQYAHRNSNVVVAIAKTFFPKTRINICPQFLNSTLPSQNNLPLYPDQRTFQSSASTRLFGCAASYQRARVNFGLQNVTPLNEIVDPNHDTHWMQKCRSDTALTASYAACSPYPRYDYNLLFDDHKGLQKHESSSMFASTRNKKLFDLSRPHLQHFASQLD